MMNKKTLPIIVFLLVIASFLAGRFSANLQVVDKNKTTTGATTPTPTSIPTISLKVEDLKKYAADLGLDQDKFNQCLDQNQKAEAVKQDITYGSSVGVSGTPAFFINGRFLGGAFPFDAFKEIIDKELGGKGSSNPKDYSQDLQNAALPQGNQPAPFNPKAIKIQVADSDPVLGPQEAKVTILEFSDFQCPYCLRGYQTMEQVLSTYKDQVRFVFKQYPLTQIHQYAQKAAEASLCANDQGKFWEYYHKLF